MDLNHLFDSRRQKTRPKRSLLLPFCLLAALVSVVEYAVGDVERAAPELILDSLPDLSGDPAEPLIRTVLCPSLRTYQTWGVYLGKPTLTPGNLTAFASP